MSGKLTSLGRRLAKVERQLIDEARREGMAGCICSAMTLADADKPEEFEAEMNEPCPAHGLRRLGMLLQVRQIGSKVAKIDQLLEIYEARQSRRKLRLSRLRQAGLELKNACENLDRRCKASAKNGKPCRAAATEGGLCFFHANPDKASELGRIGGRRHRPVHGENADPLPKLETATAVPGGLARVITDLQTGKIQPRIASVLGQLMIWQLRAIETSNLEARIAKLEKLTAPEDPAAGEPGPPQIKLEPGNLPHAIRPEDFGLREARAAAEQQGETQ